MHFITQAAAQIKHVMSSVRAVVMVNHNGYHWQVRRQLMCDCFVNLNSTYYVYFSYYLLNTPVVL